METQYDQVAADIDDPATPVGAALAAQPVSTATQAALDLKQDESAMDASVAAQVTSGPLTGAALDVAMAGLTSIQITNARALLIGDERVKVMATDVAAAPTAMTSPPTVTESATNDGALSISISSGLTSPLKWDALSVSGQTPRYYTFADNSGYAASLPAPRLAFDTDADKFGLSVQGRASWKYRIWVDGAPVTSTLQTLGITSGAAYIFVDFSTYSARLRRVEFEIECIASPIQVFSLRVKPLATVTAPGAMAAPSVALVGDSYGSGSSSTDFTLGYPRILARRLGWGNFYGHFTSVGGSGLVAAPSSTIGNYASRLESDVIPLNPALVIVQGSINDSANYATAGAALISYVNMLRAALPDVIVIPTGIVKPKTLSANEISLNTALSEAAATLGIPFVNLLGTVNVFKGTGNSTTPTGDGNADRFMFNDNSHPNTAGHEAIAAALEPLIRLALRSFVR